MTSLALESPEDLVRRRFQEAHIPLDRLETRHFPGEVIVVVFTPDSHFDDAVHLANELDDLIANGFVTVRRSGRKEHEGRESSPTSLRDPRISSLIDLLSSRSRTSEATPSLRYVLDFAENLDSVMAPRHHLVFGRRGVGKTALLVEAKSLLERRGSLTFWINLQMLRRFDASTAFLEIADRLCDLPLVAHKLRSGGALSSRRAEIIKNRIVSLREGAADVIGIQRVITELHYALNVLSNETDSDIFIFVDDMHYMQRSELPALLDMLHSLTRDNRVWLKAAGIRHQCRWFSDDPPTGLQSGHDAQIINLDVTLEEPEKARQFLWSIFRTYSEESGVKNISRFLGSAAVDRLVLASGGVPRDFLTLSASAMRIARQREKGRITGVQDVNGAAGRAADVKIRELEEDAGASVGAAERQINALNIIRHRVVDQASHTFFRLDVREKESCAREYDLVQGLMDLRLVHLINSGVSDPHEAGRRYEVYMLDLSQFTGTRFKQRLVVLDFERGALVQRRTRSKEKPFVADTARKRVQIFRNSPVFELEPLRALVETHAEPQA
jgi:hypothetical protein